MRALIGFSTCQVTRAAFEARGFEVTTCDLRPAPGRHHRGWVQDIWREDWDIGVFHPPCTYVAYSGAWAFSDGPYHQKVGPGTLVGAARRAARDVAIDLMKEILRLPYPLAMENPRGYFNAVQASSQYVHPWQFGDDMSKETHLWLNGLPDLQPTDMHPPRIVPGNGKFHFRWGNQTDSGQNKLTPSSNRAEVRSITPPGMAAAMGAQWGAHLQHTTRGCKNPS